MLRLDRPRSQPCSTWSFCVTNVAFRAHEDLSPCTQVLFLLKRQVLPIGEAAFALQMKTGLRGRNSKDIITIGEGAYAVSRHRETVV